MIKTIPEALKLGVRLTVAQRKILVLFSLILLVFDLLPPPRDQLHYLLGVQMAVARLLADLLPLLLTEENVGRQRFAWRLHSLENDLLLSLHVVSHQVSEFSVPLGALLAVLEKLDVLALGLLNCVVCLTNI